MSSREDISNQVSGHKANLSNPNTSDESKENSKKKIEELGGDDAHYGDVTGGSSTSGSATEKNPGNVAGGLKAAINNDRNSDEAKQKAQERLDKGDY